MKKIILVIFTLGLVLGLASAKQVLDANHNFDWEFTPEASTRLGFDLDTMMYGIKGAVELDLAGTIYGKQSPEFKGEDGAVVGYLKVEDLKIEIDVSNKSDDYNSKEDVYMDGDNKGNSGLIYVSWGNIVAKVFIGPVYIVLANQNNAEVRTNEGVASGPFSVVQYSIIKPEYTASRSGQAAGAFSPTGAGVTAINNSNINADGLNAIGLGFEVPDLVTIELGFETAYSYDNSAIVKATNGMITTTGGTTTVSGEADSAQSYKYNPFALSLKADLTPMEALSIKLKAAAINGLEPDTENQLLYEGFQNFGAIGNPIDVGLSVGYTLPMGDRNLTVSLGTEAEFVKMRKVSSGFQTALTAANQTLKDGYMDPVDTTSYEVGLGVKYDWSALGVSEDESDHLGYEDSDVKVTDGISLGLFYGSRATMGMENTALPYVGAQFALWDSQSGEKMGALPLKLSIVSSINYALGGELDLSSAYDSSDNKYKVSVAPRLDAGVGLEAKYTIGAITPYLGLLFKKLDVTAAEDKRTIEVAGVKVDDTTFKAEDKYSEGAGMPNTDLRVKLGTDVALSDNVTLDVQWLSGSLVSSKANTESAFTTDGSSESNDYYSNDQQTMYLSKAKAGLLSLGLKVAF